MEYIKKQPEDPAEPFKTAAYMLNERNPLHRLEERMDAKNMIAHLNWGILFTSDEFWAYKRPFDEEIVHKNKAEVEYEAGPIDQIYEPEKNETDPYSFGLSNLISGNYVKVRGPLDIMEVENTQVDEPVEADIDISGPGEVKSDALKVEKEDFLLELYDIIERDKKIVLKEQDVNKAVNTAKANISRLVRELSKEGLVEKLSSPKLKLTEKGITKARMLTRRHRVIEAYLGRKYKLDKDSVHERSHHLEHKFSDKSVEKLDQILGYPKYSPDGKRIPRIR